MKKKKPNITSTVPVILLLGGKGSRFSELDQYPKQLVNLNKHNLLSSILLYYNGRHIYDPASSGKPNARRRQPHQTPDCQAVHSA